MKTLWIFLIFTGFLFAEPTGKTAILPFSNSSLLGVDSQSQYVVAGSTTVARIILSSNEYRKGYWINNLSASYSCYLSTFAATATQLAAYKVYSSTTPAVGFRKIAASSSFSDLQECFTGSVYAIADSTTVILEAIEKY